MGFSSRRSRSVLADAVVAAAVIVSLHAPFAGAEDCDCPAGKYYKEQSRLIFPFKGYECEKCELGKTSKKHCADDTHSKPWCQETHPRGLAGCVAGKYGNFTNTVTGPKVFCETHGQQSVMNKMECQAASDALGFGAKEVVEFDMYVNVNGEVFPTGCFEHRNGCFKDPKDFSPRVCLNQYKKPEGSCWPGPCICFDGCKDCEAGKYTSSDGQTSCIPCGVGKYSVAGAAVAQTSPSVCKDCLAGKYSDQGVAQTSASVCKDCPAGNYTDSGGQTSCKACRAGQYSAAMKQTCISCSPGQYQKEAGKSICEACEPGSFTAINDTLTAVSASLCHECAPGKYGGINSTQACISCGFGRYSNRSGQASASTCTWCPPGKESSKTGQTTEQSCNTTCETGHYSRADTNCKSCDFGFFQDEIAQAACKKCPKGATGDAATGKVCVCIDPCPPGTFRNMTSVNGSCVACSRGRYNPILGAMSSDACSVCPAGRWSDTLSASSIDDCRKCPLGTASAATGAATRTTCANCTVGESYQDEEGSANCKVAVCPKGKYGDATKTGVIKPPTCNNCSVGRFNPALGLRLAEDCTLCALGRYGSPAGSISRKSCKRCPPYKYGLKEGQLNEDTGCAVCATGSFQDEAGKAACKPASCPAGQWGSAHPDCAKCATGKYSPSPGIGSPEQCLDCPKGRFGANLGADALDDCTLCAPGSYGTSAGLVSSNCSGLCLAGTTTPQAGMSECRECSRGYVASQSGRATCELCPERETTVGEGAAMCICEAGFYRVSSDEILDQQQPQSSRGGTASSDNRTCLPCPEGIECKSAGSSLGDLVLDLGMWRAGPDDRVFLRCPVAEACVGGNGGNGMSNAATFNTTTSSSSNSSGYCLEGHHGPLCAICDPGYSRWSNTVLCSKCPEDMAPSILAAIGAAVGFGVLIFICLFFNRRAPNGVLRPLINAAQNFAVVMMFSVDWPESIKTLERIVSGINIDFVQIASPACLGMPVNFYGRFVSLVLLSVAVICSPWLVSCLWHRRKGDPTNLKWADAVKRRMRDTILLVVLLHPTVAGQSFYHFRCRLVNNTWYLMVDYSLECYDSNWYAMLALVVLTIIGFALGMPVLFAWLLWKRRTELQQPETKKLFGGLYLTYKPDLYWFESVAMVFKLALWATLVFFEHGSQFQLVMSAAICVIQLVVHAHFKPYEDRFKNALQYVSYGLVTFTSSSGLLLNYIKLAVENARLASKEAELERLLGREQAFKVFTEVMIWVGTTLICFQVGYAVIRFLQKYRANLHRFGSRTVSMVAQHMPRRSGSTSRSDGGTEGESKTAGSPMTEESTRSVDVIPADAWMANPAHLARAVVSTVPGQRTPSVDVDVGGDEAAVAAAATLASVPGEVEMTTLPNTRGVTRR